MTRLFGFNLEEDIGTDLNGIAWSESTVLLPSRQEISAGICMPLSIVF
jgi:hypothetical protein